MSLHIELCIKVDPEIANLVSWLLVVKFTIFQLGLGLVRVRLGLELELGLGLGLGLTVTLTLTLMISECE